MTGSEPESDAEGDTEPEAETDRDSLERLVTALHDRLAATATRPVREDASRWLGEAEAVAGD
ncbi:hypothetical protein NKF06_14940, partial [Haloferax sp. AB510]|nr:hypothetical protein [Haloferax sp. AB510]